MLPTASWCWSNWPNSASRPTCCSSRRGGTRARRLPRGLPSRRRVIARPWCWRLPPITWSATPPPFLPPAGRGLPPPRAGGSRRSASSPSARPPNMAISTRARGSRARSARFRNLSRSRTRRPPSNTFSRAFSGTAATSCSVPVCCSTNTASSTPQASRPSRALLAKRGGICLSSPSTRMRSGRPRRSRSTML